MCLGHKNRAKIFKKIGLFTTSEECLTVKFHNEMMNDDHLFQRKHFKKKIFNRSVVDITENFACIFDFEGGQGSVCSVMSTKSQEHSIGSKILMYF